MIIMKEPIEQCQELGACDPAIDYLVKHEGREYSEDHQPDW